MLRSADFQRGYDAGYRAALEKVAMSHRLERDDDGARYRKPLWKLFGQ